MKVPIEWEEVSVAPILKGGKTVIPDVAINSVKKNTVALKGMSLVSAREYVTRSPLLQALWQLRVCTHVLHNPSCAKTIPSQLARVMYR